MNGNPLRGLRSGRPCEPKSADGYRLQVQHLGKLRQGMVLATDVPPEMLHKAICEIDALVRSLLEIANAVKSND